MTKLLYCEGCHGIIHPSVRAREPRWCGCGNHAIWWENPRTGDIRLYSKYDILNGSHVGGVPNQPTAFILGLHNALLTDPSAVTTDQFVQRTLAMTPDNYIFKQAGSLIIKFRPGMSGDSRWAESLPGDEGVN